MTGRQPHDLVFGPYEPNEHRLFCHITENWRGTPAAEAVQCCTTHAWRTDVTYIPLQRGFLFS